MDMATRIIEVAQKLIQTRGYNAFSYADIAEEVGIRKASIHYYFPNKADLLKAVVVSYRKFFRTMSAQAEQQVAEPGELLEQFVLGFGDFMFNLNRICVCCMLAAELNSLPDDVRGEIQGFFDEAEAWLTGVLQAGVKADTLQVAEPLETEARLILVGMEGALLVARAFNDWSRYETVARRLVAHVKKTS